MGTKQRAKNEVEKTTGEIHQRVNLANKILEKNLINSQSKNKENMKTSCLLCRDSIIREK
jgi:hypothetical protein